jgi:hypothetical protein
MIVERGEGASFQIDALDATANVVVRQMPWDEVAAGFEPFKAAIIADIDGAIGAEGRAVRTAPEIGNDFDFAGRQNARKRSATDLYDENRAVRHGNRAFRELQAFRNDFRFHSGLHE